MLELQCLAQQGMHLESLRIKWKDEEIGFHRTFEQIDAKGEIWFQYVHMQ